TAGVSLGAMAGAIVRLDLRPVPEAGVTSDAALVAVRRALLSGRDAPAPTARPPAARRPNVVIYVIDTVRADHLGCYGYPPPTTPEIDRFSASALRFTHAVAQSSFTLPSTASILTGLTPKHHGAVGADHAIHADATTLPEM